MNKVDLVFQESAKAFYDEWKRTERLRNLGEKLVAAVAIVVGFHLIEIETLVLAGAWQQAVRSWLALCALLALSISLALTFSGMRIGRFRGRPRGTTLIDAVKDEAVTDAMAKIKITKMYLDCRDTNAEVNDKRARLLLFSGTLLVAGFLLALASYLMARVV